MRGDKASGCAARQRHGHAPLRTVVTVIGWAIGTTRPLLAGSVHNMVQARQTAAMVGAAGARHRATCASKLCPTFDEASAAGFTAWSGASCTLLPSMVVSVVWYSQLLLQLSRQMCTGVRAGLGLTLTLARSAREPKLFPRVSWPLLSLSGCAWLHSVYAHPSPLNASP